MIKALRIKNKLSQQELAERLGVSQSTISKLEQNDKDYHVCSAHFIDALAKELKYCPFMLSFWCTNLKMGGLIVKERFLERELECDDCPYRHTEWCGYE